MMKNLLLRFILLTLISIPTASAHDHWNQLISGNGSAGWSVSGTTKVDVITAKYLHDRGVLFIDNDTEKNWARRHIPGAVNLPWLTEAKLKAVANRNEEIVFYCSGNHCYSAVQACALPLSWGYENVYYFAQGFIGWNMAGYAREVIE